MSILVTLIAAIGISIISPICEEPIYDYENEVCTASAEDIWLEYNVRYAEGRVNGKSTYFYLRKIPFKNGEGKAQWLREGEVYNNFMALVKAARENGFNFGVNSAYRTWKHQMRLWREMPQVASNPYHSGVYSHMTGYAVDFSGTYAFVPFDEINPKWFSEKWAREAEGGFELPTRFFWWLKKNAHKYGFKNTVKNEPWHWRYVGVEDSFKLVKK